MLCLISYINFSVGVLSGRVESGFEFLKSDPQPDPIRNREIGFRCLLGRVELGRLVRVIGL